MSIKINNPWVEKYRPKHLKEIVGFQSVIEKLRKFIDDFNNLQSQLKNARSQLQNTIDETQKKKLELQVRSFTTTFITKKARMLMGPPGTGKTTVVYALANDLNYSVIEMNASDARTEDAINQKLRETVKSSNLLSFTQQKSAGKLILIDEVDGIHGQSDRGGVGALEKIIASSQFPIIMTCNFRDDSKFGALYKLASPVIEIERSKPDDVGTLLKRIALQEKITVTEEQIKVIALRSEGDFRSAINDLQGLAQGNKVIDDDALANINSERDTVIKVQEFLIKFFLTTTVKQAKQVLDDVQQDDIDFNTIHRWINENILNYISKSADLRYMFENLAFADTILGYIKRTQDYSHLSYFFDILAGGIRFAKSDTVLAKNRIESPRFFRTRATPEDEYSLKLQQLYHTSLNDILKEIRPTLKQLLLDSPEAQEYFAQKFSCEVKQLEDII